MARSIWRRAAARSLALALDVSYRAAYRVEVNGRHNFTRSPATLVVSNHRGDADGPLIGAAVFDRRGLRVRGVLPSFVAREDLFRRGFLREYLTGTPMLLRNALAPLRLDSVLRLMNAYPMRRVPERTLWEVLEDVLHILGDWPLDEVLRPHWRSELDALSAGRPPRIVSDALQRRFRPVLRLRYGLTKLTWSCFRALEPHQRRVIASQLQHFVDILDHGGTLLMTPEGAVSTDGRLARLRAGLHILVNAPRRHTRLLPVGITYDFMSAGRQRVFVSLGPELTDLRGVSPKETSARVANAILAQSTVTATHLASHLLLERRDNGGGSVTREELYEHVGVQANRYAALGMRVDPRLLVDSQLASCVSGYLAFCTRFGTLLPLEPGRFIVPNNHRVIAAGRRDPCGVLAYADNELRSLGRVWPSISGA